MRARTPQKARNAQTIVASIGIINARMLDDLELFAQIVDSGSLSAAARRLGIQTSTVSRRLRDLETRFGARLLERSTRSMRLTDAGARLLTHTRTALAAVDEGRNAVLDAQARLSGRLAVSAALPEGDTMLVDWLAAFCVQHPGISLDVLLEDRYVDLLAENIDLAVRVGPLADSSLVACRLGTVHEALYASPAYLQAHRAPVDLDGLAKHRLVAYSSARFDTAWRFADGTRHAGPFQHCVNHMTGAARLAAAGLGITRLPLHVASSFVQEGKLLQVSTALRLTTRDLYAVYPHRLGTSRRLRALVHWLQARFATLPKL